jgi:hypothetical protein
MAAATPEPHTSPLKNPQSWGWTTATPPSKELVLECCRYLVDDLCRVTSAVKLGKLMMSLL